MGRMGLSLASGVMSVAGITRTVLVVGAPTAGMSWISETISAEMFVSVWPEDRYQVKS